MDFTTSKSRHVSPLLMHLVLQATYCKMDLLIIFMCKTELYA